MSYFHPWTLRSADADEHVKYAGSLRSSGESWQDALHKWLDGNILSHEAQRYIRNFFNVHRMRPHDEENDDCNSDDIVSDEELEVSRSSLAEALATRIGGREGNDEDVTEEINEAWSDEASEDNTTESSEA